MASIAYFLKIDGVDGESADDRHKGEIELVSFGFGASNATAPAGAGSGAGVGKVALSEFHVTKRIDKASPRLFSMCCTGEHVRSVRLVGRKAGKDQQDFMVVTLSDVLVSSFQETGDAAPDAVPTEQIALRYAKIEIRYRSQRPDGSLGDEVIGGWDAVANRKL